MKRESRKVQRFAVQLPCLFGSDERRSDGTVLNLSRQGCAMTTEHLPTASTYVALEIDLLNGEVPTEIELAAVRWISEHRCGLEFIRVSPEAMKQLHAFVSLLEKTP